MGSPLLQSHGWLSVIIKVFGHFPRRSRRGSWWHSCIPKHRGGNYNEASIHFSDHKVCSWHQFKNSQAVVEKDYLWLSLLQCRQCTLIYLGNYRNHRKQPNICFVFFPAGVFSYCCPGKKPGRLSDDLLDVLVNLQHAWHDDKDLTAAFTVFCSLDQSWNVASADQQIMHQWDQKFSSVYF